MIRWVKPGVLSLADRTISPGEIFSETLLAADRIREFLDRGWIEKAETPPEPKLQEGKNAGQQTKKRKRSKPRKKSGA